MKRFPVAALVGLAALPAAGQPPHLSMARDLETVVVTATRALGEAATLRDTVVITRDELDAQPGLTLAEVLQRQAGVELRATGGPGQPTGLFLRGAGAAQTLVLVDGLRVGSATAGTTAIESLPLEMVERIEVVKGSMSSLYGSEAIGGVVQVFTRGKDVPHLFAAAHYGSHNDRRASAGLATADERSRVSFAAGARKVDAPSATNSRALFGVHDPDRDPHENVFANLSASHRLWQGETVTLEAFATRSKTAFDGGDPADRSEQLVGGARVTSSTQFARDWNSRLSAGYGVDELEFVGPFPARFETRQHQAAWINDFAVPGGNAIVGLETVRQRVAPGLTATGEPLYLRTRRDTDSAFVSLNQAWEGQRLEASYRHDRDDQFGRRNTGSASYGIAPAPGLRLSATLSRGFRAPTFNDLYLTFPGYTPNPALQPERSRGAELSLRGTLPEGRWRVSAFDNRLEDLIVATAQTVRNVERARIRGIEASLEATWLATRWRANVTVQRPRDEDTGTRLQSRAQAFGSLEASRAFGAWTATAAMVAVGERFDSIGEAPESRLPAYATADLRLRYAAAKFWSIELAVLNVADRRYESAVGYDAPRRTVLLSVRFDAF